MTVERDNKRKTIATPYHPEELRWEDEDCVSNSIHGETIPDPWLGKNTKRKAEATKNRPKKAQTLSSSHVEDQSSGISLEEKGVSESTPEKDIAPTFDDFPSDEFANTEEITDFSDLDTEILDTAEGIDLPDLDENAHQPPWDTASSKIDSDIRRAARKASFISDMLILKNPQEQDTATNYLTEIFSAQPHQATFRAFKDMVMEDLSFTDLKNIIELRQAWAERPEWWLYRHEGKVIPIPRGQNALSWKLARRICQARWEFPPDGMIEESWLEEWRNLRPGTAGYQSFPYFIEEKMKHKDAEILHEGLQQNTL